MVAAQQQLSHGARQRVWGAAASTANGAPCERCCCIVDRDLAVAWPRRTPHVVVQACRERGMQVIFLPEVDGYQMNRAVNFVTLGPRRILLEAGYTKVQEFYRQHGIECVTVAAVELVKAARGFGCLTGVLQRDRA